MQIAMSAEYPLENPNAINTLFTPRCVHGYIIVSICRREARSAC